MRVHKGAIGFFLSFSIQLMLWVQITDTGHLFMCLDINRLAHYYFVLSCVCYLVYTECVMECEYGNMVL